MGGWVVIVGVLAVLLVAGALVVRLIRAPGEGGRAAPGGYVIAEDRHGRDDGDGDDDDIDIAGGDGS